MTAMETPGIAEALLTCHRVNSGVNRMTFEMFKAAVTKTDAMTKDVLHAYQQFRSNPAKWLADVKPQTLAVELIELILELAPV